MAPELEFISKIVRSLWNTSCSNPMVYIPKGCSANKPMTVGGKRKEGKEGAGWETEKEKFNPRHDFCSNLMSGKGDMYFKIIFSVAITHEWHLEYIFWQRLFLSELPVSLFIIIENNLKVKSILLIEINILLRSLHIKKKSCS